MAELKEDMKGKAALIVAAMGKPKDEPEAETEDMEEESGRDEAKNEAASSVMAALRSNDVGAFREALDDYISLCQY